MSNLRIGEKLKVYAIAEPEYDMWDQRWIVSRTIKPQIAWYVGYTYKHEGTYHKGGWSPTPSEPLDFEPSWLEVGNTWLVHRIRFHERGKEYYCFPSDANLLEEEVKYYGKKESST